MAEYRRGRAAAALVLACASWLAAGCESGSEVGPAARPEPLADPQPETPSATLETSATPSPSDTDCSRAERRAARDMWPWRLVSDATSGHSDRARRAVSRYAAKVRRRLVDECGTAPAAFRRFLRDVRPAVTAPRFGDQELDTVLSTWLRWGSMVGAPQAAQYEISRLDYCRREFFPRFHASYRTWWKWTDTGKAWWVDISFDNQTGRVLDGSMGGTARATRLLPDPFGWERGPRPGPGMNAVLHWGGSSAEMLELQPGTTTIGAAPDIDQDVHTTADGTFQVVEVSVGLAPRGQRYSCSPPVPEAP